MPSQHAPHPRNTPGTTPRTGGWLAALLWLAYAALLYLQAATASLDDRYLPGIRPLRALACPGALLLIPLVLAWRTRHAALAQLAWRTAAGACVLCAALLAWIALAPAPGGASAHLPPQARTLGTVLHAAMRYPAFSNRSWIATTGSAAWALIACGLAARCVRRARPPNAAAFPR